MAPQLTRVVVATIISISAIALTQCGRSEPASPASPGSIASTSTNALGPTSSNAVVVGQFKVCKLGNVPGTFTVSANPPGGATSIVTSPIEIASGTCQVVAENATPTGVTITVTETSAGLQSITDNANGSSVPLGPVSAFINYIHGVSFTFTNHVEPQPDPDPPGGNQGCTPGYWKNHLSQWVTYSPGDDFDTTFGVNFFNPDKTLLQAVNLGGGGLNALARHAVAALLNLASQGVDYPLSLAQVLDIVQGDGAYAGQSVTQRTNLLVAANEAGCPLN
jgi:hypothetical protein